MKLFFLLKYVTFYIKLGTKFREDYSIKEITTNHHHLIKHFDSTFEPKHIPGSSLCKEVLT